MSNPDISDFVLTLNFSYRELGRLIGWDRQKVKRTLDKAGVHRRADGRIWVADIKKEMPVFLDSWAEVLHQKALAAMRGEEDPRDCGEDDY